jgi:hypothetical protein
MPPSHKAVEDNDEALAEESRDPDAMADEANEGRPVEDE